MAPSATTTRWSLLRGCWVLILRIKKLAPKLHVHSVNCAVKLVHTRRALSNTIYNSHQELVSGQACSDTPCLPSLVQQLTVSLILRSMHF